MKSRKLKYGSLVFVGVFSSGVNGGEPPTLHSRRLRNWERVEEKLRVCLPVVGVGGRIRQTDGVLYV